MRLNQYIAKHTGISRRKADEVIEQGNSKVNGSIGEFSTQIGEDDQVEVFDGKIWKDISQNTQSSNVLLLYKPARVMTTRDDPEKRKTIYDLIPAKFRNFKSAGRLDYMSEGLLVLSENGHLILSLTHPKFKTKKVYLVGLTRALHPKQIAQAASGSIEIEGYKLNPVKINPTDLSKYGYLKLEPQLYWYEFELSEGRNRQIRKMASYFDNSVARLIRVTHGPFNLNAEIVKKGWVETGMLK